MFAVERELLKLLKRRCLTSRTRIGELRRWL